MQNNSTICGGEKYITAFQLYDGTILNCMIMDTAGQERFDALNLTYYKKADAILLVYDISNKKTFDKIKEFYIQKIKDNCSKDIPVLLLGNKTDLENQREVTYDEGIALALDQNYEYQESSCIHNKNVAGAFECLIERWNFERHRMKKSLVKSNSKENINEKKNKNKNNFKLNSVFTDVDLDKEMDKFISQRARSHTVAIGNRKTKEGTISLERTIKKHKNKKCC